MSTRRELDPQELRILADIVNGWIRNGLPERCAFEVYSPFALAQYQGQSYAGAALAIGELLAPTDRMFRVTIPEPKSPRYLVFRLFVIEKSARNTVTIERDLLLRLLRQIERLGPEVDTLEDDLGTSAGREELLRNARLSREVARTLREALAAQNSAIDAVEAAANDPKNLQAILPDATLYGFLEAVYSGVASE